MVPAISASPQITEFPVTVKTQLNDPPTTGQSSYEVTAQQFRCKLLHAAIWPSSRQPQLPRGPTPPPGWAVRGRRAQGWNTPLLTSRSRIISDSHRRPPSHGPAPYPGGSVDTTAWQRSRSLPGRPGRHPYPKASRPRTAVALQRSTPRPARAL